MKKNELPKRKPGAQPGNLSSATSVLPALERLKKGKPLPAYLNRVITMAEIERQELIQDKGGPEIVTESEKLLTGAWKGARAGELLIWNHILGGAEAIQTEKDGTWDLMPGVQRLIGFLSVQARILKTLGLERRARNVKTLEQYVEETYAEKSAEEK